MTDQPWFLLSSDGEISIRVSNGMQVGESADGELLLVALPEEARIRLLIEDDGVYAESLAGFALNDPDTDIPVTRCFLAHGDRIELSGSALVLSSRFSDSYTSLGETVSNGRVYRLETSDLVDTAILDRHDPYSSDDEALATSEDQSVPENDAGAEPPTGPDAVDPFTDAAREDTTLESVLAATDSEDAPADLVPAEKMPSAPVKPVTIERRDELPRASNDSRIESAISAVVPEATDLRARERSGTSVWLAVGLAAMVAAIVVAAWLAGSNDAPDERVTLDRPASNPSPSFRDSPNVERIDNSVAAKQDRPTVSNPSVNANAPDNESARQDGRDTVDSSLAEPMISEQAADRQAIVDGPAVFAGQAEQVPDTVARRQQVNRLLDQAESFFQQGIWTRGEDGSAAERFLRVLDLDPGNAKAARGLDRLRTGIANMRDQDAARESRIRLERMIDAAVAQPAPTPDSPINPSVAPADNVDELVALARQRMAEGFITEPDADNAVRYAQRVLALDAENVAATEILDEAAGKLLATAVDLRLAGQNSAARSLVASVLEFAPNHATARRYRVEWLD
ncbi:MAG: hypothetical protein NXH85_17290 [Pseudomonadaceae bacterium]|nr:hypothetical protein [Pseudomonadaceae bacterium]